MERPPPRQAAWADSIGLPWTATRCHRLLRPLLTHVAALRKESNRRRQLGSLREDASEGAGDDGVPGSGLGRPQKKIRYTYSLKGSKRTGVLDFAKVGDEHVDYAHFSEEKENQPSKTKRMPPEPNMYMATPVIQRIRGQWSSPVLVETVVSESEVTTKPGRCYHSHEVCARRCFFEDGLAKIKRTTDPSTFALYESIYRALDALLRATSASEAHVAKPKSLLSMCLRKVPDYLAEVEAWKRQELEENGAGPAASDSDTSFELYSDLESLGTGRCGWKHLAAVVQSHGIRIVKDAISERLVADDFAVLVAKLCSEVKAVSDRRQLLEAVLRQQHRKPCGPDDDIFNESWSRSAPVLELLRPSIDVMDRTGTSQYMARLTADLLCSQLLPQDWALTRGFARIWSLAMRHLTSRTTHRDTILFFITSIRVFCDQIQQKGRRLLSREGEVTTAQQLLINSLATLSTLVILGQETLVTGPSVNWRNQTITFCKRAEYIIRASLANARSSGGRTSRSCSTYVLLLAHFFIADTALTPGTSPLVPTAKNSLATFWATIDIDSRHHYNRQYYEATMALIASIARGCTRKNSAKPAAHTYLIKLCDKLDAACPQVKALRNIRVDAAFYLADQTGDLWDLNFAERIAATGQADEGTCQTPGKRTATFTGFRWDEGISEWVTATPVLTRRKQSINGPVIRARRTSPGIPELLEEAESPQQCSIRNDSEEVVENTLQDFSNVNEDTQPPHVRGLSEPGTSCHAKTPRRQSEGSYTHEELGEHNSDPGRTPRKTLERFDGVSGIGGPDDDDLDELQFGQVNQEIIPPTPTCKGVKSEISLKRKRSRRSLVSLRPPRNISNEYYDDESSADELGM